MRAARTQCTHTHTHKDIGTSEHRIILNIHEWHETKIEKQQFSDNFFLNTKHSHSLRIAQNICVFLESSNGTKSNGAWWHLLKIHCVTTDNNKRHRVCEHELLLLVAVLKPVELSSIELNINTSKIAKGKVYP